MHVFNRTSPLNGLYMKETFMMSVRVEKRSEKWNACKMKSFGPQTKATKAPSAIHKKIMSAPTLIQIHASCSRFCCYRHCTKLKSMTKFLYRKISNIRHLKSQNSQNDSCLVLQFYRPNPLKPGVREWRCSSSSADRLCSSYICVINKFIV